MATTKVRFTPEDGGTVMEGFVIDAYPNRVFFPDEGGEPTEDEAKLAPLGFVEYPPDQTAAEHRWEVIE